MNIKYQLMGHEVSKEVYEEYANRKYPFAGHLLTLDGVHLWATSPEIARDLPEFAAEARKIIEQIGKEIGVAVHDEITHDSFFDFLDALEKAYTDGRNKMAQLRRNLEKANATRDRIWDDNDYSDMDRQYAVLDWQKAQETFRNGLTALQKEVADEIKNIRSDLDRHADEYYRAKPEKIDNSVVQLMDSGIVTAHDLEHLASQHRGNPTMLKVILQHSKKMAAQDTDATQRNKYREISQKLQVMTNSAVITDGFDKLARAAKLGINEHENIEAAWLKDFNKNMPDVRKLFADVL